MAVNRTILDDHMKIKKTVVILFIITGLVFSFCISTDAENEALVMFKTGEKFQIDFGQWMVNEKTGMTLKFTGVQDGRCPKGLYCVWAGNARVIIELDQQEFELNSVLEPRIHQIDSLYTFHFSGLDPYPVYGKEFHETEYTATIKIEKFQTDSDR